jgi:hypothetical protein
VPNEHAFKVNEGWQAVQDNEAVSASSVIHICKAADAVSSNAHPLLLYYRLHTASVSALLI